MIIIESILTTFEVKGSWSSSGNWLEPKAKPSLWILSKLWLSKSVINTVCMCFLLQLTRNEAVFDNQDRMQCNVGCFFRKIPIQIEMGQNALKNACYNSTFIPLLFQSLEKLYDQTKMSSLNHWTKNVS